MKTSGDLTSKIICSSFPSSNVEVCIYTGYIHGGEGQERKEDIVTMQDIMSPLFSSCVSTTDIAYQNLSGSLCVCVCVCVC